VRVLGVEEADLDHDAALARFYNKVLEAREKLRIPFVEIELVTTVDIARLITGNQGTIFLSGLGPIVLSLVNSPTSRATRPARCACS